VKRKGHQLGGPNTQKSIIVVLDYYGYIPERHLNQLHVTQPGFQVRAEHIKDFFDGPN